MSKRQIGPSTKMFPMPTMLVAVRTGENSANISTIAWGGILGGSPPIIGLSVARSHYSTPFLQKERNFTINVPSPRLALQADYCGVVSGAKDPDKAATCGLTLAPSTKIPSPLIAECPLNFECRTYQEIEFRRSILFLAEVVETHVDEGILDGEGNIVTEKLDPLVYLPHKEDRRSGGLGSPAFPGG